MKTGALRLAIASQAALAIALLGAPGTSMAHAYPSGANPRAGETVESSPASVTITYDAPIEQAFAKLQVLDALGHNHDAGPPRVGPEHRTLTVELGPLAPGQYKVKWQVVADDGHRTYGSYTFTVAAQSR